jgi:hypothetical protein
MKTEKVEKEQFKILTIEAAKTGWIIREKGEPAEIFHIWPQVIRKLEQELTSKDN